MGQDRDDQDTLHSNLKVEWLNSIFISLIYHIFIEDEGFRELVGVEPNCIGVEGSEHSRGDTLPETPVSLPLHDVTQAVEEPTIEAADLVLPLVELQNGFYGLKM